MKKRHREIMGSLILLFRNRRAMWMITKFGSFRNVRLCISLFVKVFLCRFVFGWSMDEFVRWLFLCQKWSCLLMQYIEIIHKQKPIKNTTIFEKSLSLFINPKFILLIIQFFIKSQSIKNHSLTYSFIKYISLAYRPF